jgi:CBS domain-containing protein
MLTYLYFINIMLAIFNLLPGFPLDGGRILRSLLAFWKKDLLKATQIASRAGILFAFLLMTYGLVVILMGNFWGIWTVLIGMFLKDAAESSYKQVLFQDVFRSGTIDQIMQRNPVVIPPDITIRQLIDEYLWRYHYGSFPVGQERALGIITFTDIKKVSPEQRANVRVRDIMHSIDDSLRISTGDTIVAAFEKASNNAVGRLIVVDREDLILGYLSLRDIAQAFHYRSQLRAS